MFNLFRKKTTIAVTFIDDNTSDPIGTSEIPPEQLPGSFDQPASMHVAGKDWQVAFAQPAKAKEWLKEKKLTLYLLPPDQPNPYKVFYTIPSISNDLPATTAVSNPLFNDFMLELSEDDWRQIEYLPLSNLTAIQNTMKEVEAILTPDNTEEAPRYFKRMHIRKLPRRQLSIPFDEFTQQLTIAAKGSLRFTGSRPNHIVEDGFALRTSNYTYYGTSKNGIIHELNLQRFECADDEFNHIAQRFNLTLVDWCRGKSVYL